MVCTPNNTPYPNFESNNYVSGNNNREAPVTCDNCQNNPDRTGESFRGPIPTGEYTIGSMNSRGRRNLTPLGFNNMQGRDHFQIHGCGNRDRCSAGCIAATTNATRDRLNALLSLEEGNNTLTVEP